MMIDWTRVKDLRSEIGREDFGDIVSLFLEEADEVVARLSGLTDAKSMENNLHFLKGSALNLGFSHLAQMCQDEERRAATGQTDLALAAVIDAYRQSRSTFLAGLDRSAA